MRFAYSPLSIAVLTALSSTVFAEKSDQSEQVKSQASVKFSTIVIQAKTENEVGKTVYNKEDIQQIPNGSKTITELLKVNPNVQFDSNARSGLQQGELNATDISINGSLPYDNKFLINGLSINNNINPGSDAKSNTLNEIMGSSQTVTINADLLCKITLLDKPVFPKPKLVKFMAA